ncbi:PAS domain S-box/diguanylate cyclase domain containing protein [Gracilaria domingensis]|nr:PAS domain S-box/diguanylate cyclase domain containing protein [Gracilaria domingensis]
MPVDSMHPHSPPGNLTSDLPITGTSPSHSKTMSVQQDSLAIARRRRDARRTRATIGDQFEQLRRVLPRPSDGGQLTAKAQILETALRVIKELMNRATRLAVELAVVSPQATRSWVSSVSDQGRRPLSNTVISVMKLFAARRNWRYAEWWTLDEKRMTSDEQERMHHEHMEADKPDGVIDHPANVHGCVVRDSTSVMRLGCTIIHRTSEDEKRTTDHSSEEDERLTKFAQASQDYEFHPRMGIPGRVWTSQRAEWLVDLANREAFIRSELAQEFGMETCLAVPIKFGGHVHSVMAFYCTERRLCDAECLDLATLLVRCLEQVYSPGQMVSWQVSTESEFPPSPL